jgi:hypothetical protein
MLLFELFGKLRPDPAIIGQDEPGARLFFTLTL